jgi:hypothetical protein
VEDPEDKLYRFYGGLRREIQDIVDYKDFNTTNQLFQIAMLAEKELQGRQQQQPPRSRSNYGSSYAPKANMSPTAKSSGALPLAPSASARSPSSASIQSTPPATTPSNVGKTRLQVPAKSSSSVASTGRTSTIQCHRCQGLGHMARECPSKRAYIVTEDGGYVSASDIEDDAKEEPASNEEQHGLSLGSEDVGN